MTFEEEDDTGYDPEDTAPNPFRIAAARARRRSNAAGKHGDRRLKRLRDRGARKRAALKEEQS